MGDISVGSNLQYYEQYFVMMERNTIFIIVISLNEMTKYAYLVDFRLLFNLLERQYLQEKGNVLDNILELFFSLL